MAMKNGFVGDECGQQNPLVKLTTHFTTDRSLIGQVSLIYFFSAKIHYCCGFRMEYEMHTETATTRTGLKNLSMTIKMKMFQE